MDLLNVCQILNFTREVDISQGCQRSGKSQGKFLFFKVREKSGNSVKSQGKSLDMRKSGNFVMNAHDTFFITIVHLYVPYFSALYRPRWKNPYIFFMLYDISPYKSFLKKISVLDTVYWLIQVVTWCLVFSFTDKFSFELSWSKIS